MARPKGSKNKTAAEVKEQILACYHKLGGLKSYVKWAEQKPDLFYRQYASLAPREVNVDARIRDETSLTDAELAAIATGSSIAAAEETGGEDESSELH